MEEKKTGTVFIRTKKERNYTVMDNTFLRDDKLSARAKGIFAYILYLPEDWCIYQSELVKHFKDGKDALRAAIKELEVLGYITKEKIKNTKGQFSGWQYTVNETPISPKSEIPMSDTPKSVNPPLLNTNNKINTDNNNISTSLKSEPPKFKAPKMTKAEENDLFLSSLTKEEYNLSEKCADLMIDYLKPITKTYDPAIHKKTWQVDFVRRSRDKNISLSDVLLCVQYVHDDYTGFEQPINQSPEKLFKKFDYLYGKAVSRPKRFNTNKNVDNINKTCNREDYDTAIF